MMDIVNRGEWLKPGKHQKIKHICQDLCRKVRDRAQSFVLHLYSMHELRNRQNVNFVLVSSSARSKLLLCSVVNGQGQTSEQKNKYNKEICWVS